jgi:DNA-binding CsgD family transcriptional regulator
VTADGIHAQLTVRPRPDCPLGRVVADYDVRRLVPAQAGTPPQVVLETDATDAADDPVLRPVEETKETVVCRLRGDAAATTDGDEQQDEDATGRDDETWACAHCPVRCLAGGFDHLPLRPYDLSVTDGRLRLAFAAVDEAELRTSMERLDDLGERVSLQSLRTDAAADDASEPPTVLVDLSDLTARQRETAALAVRRGYFEAGGVSAAEVADELDVAKATVSEHLRAVRAKVGRQLFPDDAGSDRDRD